MKLQRTSYRKSQSGNDSQTGVRDLREKLSAPTQFRPVNVEAAQHLVSAVKGNSAPKPVPAIKPVTQPVPAAPAKPIQKQAPLDEERSVAGLLQSLGLGKSFMTLARNSSGFAQALKPDRNMKHLPQNLSARVHTNGDLESNSDLAEHALLKERAILQRSKGQREIRTGEYRMKMNDITFDLMKSALYVCWSFNI